MSDDMSLIHDACDALGDALMSMNAEDRAKLDKEFKYTWPEQTNPFTAILEGLCSDIRAAIDDWDIQEEEHPTTEE